MRMIQKINVSAIEYLPFILRNLRNYLLSERFFRDKLHIREGGKACLCFTGRKSVLPKLYDLSDVSCTQVV